MPDLETLFVRIDADLGEFKRGLREAGRETRAFANETNRAFAEVGTALDLSPFRKELAQSERAAIQAAERMSKAFAGVARAQESAAARSLEKLAQGAGRPGVIVRQDGQRSSDAPFGLSQSREEIQQRVMGGATGAGLAFGALSIGRIAAVLALPGGAVLFLGLTLAGVLLPEIIKAFSGGGGSIESLENEIDALQSQKRLIDQFSSPIAERKKAENQAQIDALKSLRDTLLEQQRLFGDNTARTQEFLTAFTELSDCLRQLCARIDALAPVPSGGRPQAGVLSGGAGDDVLLGGAGEDSLFAGAGLREFQRQTIDARGPLDDLSAGFVELTEAAGGFAAQGGALVELLARSNALFGEQSGLLGHLGVQVPELGESFSTFLARTSQEAGTLNDAVGVLGQGFIDAFEGAIQRGESFGDVLKGLALDLARLAAQSGANALIGSLLGGLFGGGGPGPLPDPAGFAESLFAKGAAFAPAGSVMARNIKAFARGGIVDTPEAFAFADGLGIMGEAGPEAILPLARARSGELGVRAMIGRRPEAGGSGPAAAGMTVFIDARGADREGLARVERKVQELHGDLVRVNRSIEPRAIRAWSEHRRRGGFR